MKHQADPTPDGGPYWFVLSPHTPPGTWPEQIEPDCEPADLAHPDMAVISLVFPDARSLNDAHHDTALAVVVPARFAADPVWVGVALVVTGDSDEVHLRGWIGGSEAVAFPAVTGDGCAPGIGMHDESCGCGYRVPVTALHPTTEHPGMRAQRAQRPG